MREVRVQGHQLEYGQKGRSLYPLGDQSAAGWM